ncbi:MAG TPA: GGDEF domain-containing protein [Pseudoneobacillus sp.]|nr:GGDEF domain-containing protein [Pseudoneobacillus sp.]
MVQSIVVNLGILLLMHLMINTVYLFQQQRKLSYKLVTILHIFIVTITTISMFYYPIQTEDHLYNLSLIPMMFIAFFHGWRFALPVVILATIFRFFLNNETPEMGEVLFEIILPTLFSLVLYPLKVDKIRLAKPIIVLTACWLVSDFSILSIPAHDIFLFAKIALLHYSSFLLAAAIMYFFVFSGIQHLEVINKMRFFAEHDPLTGLYNMRKIEDIIQNSRIHGKQMFIAMVDIDHFKTINDTFGHQAGDQAIQSVANIILKNCSRHIFAGRYGGDEFILFLMADTISDASAILDSIRKSVAATSIIPLGYKQHCQLSLSIGLASLQNSSELTTTIEQADKQLYHAKQSGRNCVCG